MSSRVIDIAPTLGFSRAKKYVNPNLDEELTIDPGPNGPSPPGPWTFKLAIVRSHPGIS
jgi:hypothetical protein